MGTKFQSNFSIRALLSNAPQCLKLEKAGEQIEVLNISSEPKTSDYIASNSTVPNSPSAIYSSSRSDDEQPEDIKPPYTYCSLIYMSLRNSPGGRLTLKEIIQWIENKFAFYKKNKGSWTNSIRHNLSLNPMFVHIERAPDDPGRGKYWAIDPEYDDVTVGENTGRLRRSNSARNSSFAAGPIRSKSASLMNLHAHAVHPYCTTYNTTPKAIYFPTPEEQFRLAAQYQAQQQQQTLMEQYRLSLAMQSWHYYGYQQLPLLQQSLVDARYMQSMYRGNNHT